MLNESSSTQRSRTAPAAAVFPDVALLNSVLEFLQGAADPATGRLATGPRKILLASEMKLRERDVVPILDALESLGRIQRPQKRGRKPTTEVDQTRRKVTEEHLLELEYQAAAAAGADPEPEPVPDAFPDAATDVPEDQPVEETLPQEDYLDQVRRITRRLAAERDELREQNASQAAEIRQLRIRLSRANVMHTLTTRDLLFALALLAVQNSRQSDVLTELQGFVTDPATTGEQ
jgi:hypothetical protein